MDEERNRTEQKEMAEYAGPQRNRAPRGYTSVKRGDGPVVGGVVRVHQEKKQAEERRRGERKRKQTECVSRKREEEISISIVGREEG